MNILRVIRPSENISLKTTDHKTVVIVNQRGAVVGLACDPKDASLSWY